MPTNNDSGKKYSSLKNCQACNTQLSKISKGRIYRVQKENVIRILNQFETKSKNIIQPNDYVCDSCISSANDFHHNNEQNVIDLNPSKINQEIESVEKRAMKKILVGRFQTIMKLSLIFHHQKSVIKNVPSALTQKLTRISNEAILDCLVMLLLLVDEDMEIE
ncbi:unnamed protein product [Brachionus calyciflorus]|uniref:Uncharacterized protein n=1 Tax=Brachionus calyciflorus TaxID=104777 RepID=A0A813XE28_9BILA|nr:unnamed protein product [Brachionus calyciflorus]